MFFDKLVTVVPKIVFLQSFSHWKQTVSLWVVVKSSGFTDLLDSTGGLWWNKLFAFDVRICMFIKDKGVATVIVLFFRRYRWLFIVRYCRAGPSTELELRLYCEQAEHTDFMVLFVFTYFNQLLMNIETLSSLYWGLAQSLLLLNLSLHYSLLTEAQAHSHSTGIGTSKPVHIMT